MRRIVTFGLFILIGLATIVSCRKKEDTIAIITVRNNANQVVSGAQVVVYGSSTTGIPSNVALYDTTLTNSEGKATFNFNDVYQLGQAGVAVLDIEVVKDSQQGQGIIKIEEETTSEETVYIQ